MCVIAVVIVVAILYILAPALLNIQRIMDMLGAQPFILCGEVVLFQRLFCIECVCIQGNI